MNYYKKISLVILAALVFEFGWCQRSVWLLLLNKDIPNNISFELSDMNLVNWKKTDSGYVSQEDPIIYLPTNPIYLYGMELSVDVSPWPVSTLLYYTDKSGTIRTEELTSQNTTLFYRIDQQIGPVLRVDIGESAGLVLTNARAIINPTTMHPSISRIIAVVLIYVCGSLLFRIQRMPDYTKYIQMKE